MSFTQLGLPAPILEGVRAAGYSQPTPIQRRAIPIILAGHDLVGASQTGTGKTAAFLLPILTRLAGGKPGLKALVLVPTRELAAQALRRPMRLDLGERTVPAPAIAQAFYPVARDLKVDLLSRMLSLDATRKALVFVRSKHGADRLARRLRDLGHAAAALHGDRS